MRSAGQVIQSAAKHLTGQPHGVGCREAGRVQPSQGYGAAGPMLGLGGALGRLQMVLAACLPSVGGLAAGGPAMSGQACVGGQGRAPALAPAAPAAGREAA